MKVIGLTYNYDCNDVNKFPDVFLMADSSLLKDNKPLFLPDFSERYEARAAIAIKVCRLGKNISTKFAHRYYDAITLGLNVTATDLKNNAPSSDLATSFDGSAVLGTFIPLEEYKLQDEPKNYTVSIDDKVVTSGELDKMVFNFDSIIEYLSRFYTLKIGDIIYTGYNKDSFELCIGQHVLGKLNENTVLDFKVK